MGGFNLGLPRKRASAAKTTATPAGGNKKGNLKASPKTTTKKGGDANGEKIEHGYYAPDMHPTNGKRQQPQAMVDESVNFDFKIAQFKEAATYALLATQERNPGHFAADDAKTDLVVHTLDSGFQHLDDSFIPALIPTTISKNWGAKPYPTMTEAGPIFNNYDDQPAARSSNAATSPALWEDVVQRFHHGRYHEIVEGDTVTKIDQKEMVLFKMMDMRPARQDDPDGEPRRLPMVYECKGIPLNWKNKVLVKAMNDRRYQALQRARNAPRWDARERAHIVALLNEFPDISITELTERLNFRFKGDAVESSMLPPHKLHPGRTIEDVRAEYLEHKEKYDAGIVPTAPRMNKELGLEEKKTAKALEEIYKIFAPTDKDGKPINVPAKRTRRSKKEIEKDDSLDYTNDGGEADEADESMTSMSTSPKKFSVATPKAKEILKPKSQIAKAIKGKTSTSALPVKKSKAVKATRTAPDASKLAKKRKAMDDFPSNSMPIPLMKSRKRVKLSDVMLADKLESAARDPKKAQLFRMQDENGNYTKKFDDQLLSLAGYSSDEAEAAGALVQMSAGPDRMDALVKELLEVADLIRDRATAMRETEEVSARVDRDGDSEMEDSVEEGSDDSGAAEEEDDDEEIII